MEVIKAIIRQIGNIIKFILGTIGSYLGIVINLGSTILGILAGGLVILLLAGVCAYVKVEPMFQEARETAFDKLINLSEDDFVMMEDTVIYGCTGKKLGAINAGHYIYVDISDVSEYLYEGYIAVEDRRFKTHAGVDFLATMRAGVALIRHSGEITQGGSTITQQVIKNNLLTQDQTYSRKLTEILLAPTIEKEFGKDKIMEFYCNTNFYGNRCYGVEAASQYYFGISAKDVRPWEAALLIGLSNNPAAYNPVTHPEAAMEKRNSVLETMYAEGVINKKQYKKSVKKDLDIVQNTTEGSNENYQTSYAVHCAALALMEEQGFEFQYIFTDGADYTRYQKQYNAAYSAICEEIRSGGYQIYTSLNNKIQKKLQKSLDATLAFNREMNSEGTKYALQGAAVCVDNESGYVVAIVGGRGKNDVYNRGYLSARQPGSSIKPLIDYTPAFETGEYTPSTYVMDQEIEDGPKNSGGSYRGRLQIREAVARSLNTVAWQVLEDITPEYGLGYLGNMRFKTISYIDNDNLALSLGGFTDGVRVVDMAKGYSTLANNGQYSDRTCIKRIVHETDGEVYKNKESITQVYSEDAAYMMTDVLKGVISEPYGTGRSLALDNGQIAAGKTGTTNNSKDIWFCGYTSYYTTSVWVGYDTPRMMAGYTGASLTGQIWKNFMNSIHTGLKAKDFTRPSTVYLAQYDSNGAEISGTMLKGKKQARIGGYDFFSGAIKEKALEYQRQKAERRYNKLVLDHLEEFENMFILSVSDYYAVDSTYELLRKEISKVSDDDTRTYYATRAAEKYDALNEEKKNWDDVVSDYETEQSEEAARLTEEKQREAEAAREATIKQTRIDTFNTALNKLKSYTEYQPDDMSELVADANNALAECKEYKEYSSMASQLRTAISKLRSLPTKAEYDEQQAALEQENEEIEDDLNGYINGGNTGGAENP